MLSELAGQLAGLEKFVVIWRGMFWALKGWLRSCFCFVFALFWFILAFFEGGERFRNVSLA